MNKEKWLLRELGAWREQSLIDAETAAILIDRYKPKKNTGFLIILFSVIGSLLIGAGIILIMAKNWYFLPFSLRVVLAFLPLAASQALDVYVVRRRRGSIAWREAAAILTTASVFTALALVSQIFHISGDLEAYLLTCGLLSLPMIYILDAAAPLAVYYWTILQWAAMGHTVFHALLAPVLYAGGALYVFLKRNAAGAGLIYLTWISLTAGFAGVIIIGSIVNSSLLLAVLCYFTLLLAVSGKPLREQTLTPFNIIGGAGGLVTVAILTWRDMWGYADFRYIEGSILPGVMLIPAFVYASLSFRRDQLRSLLVFVLSALCAMRYLWMLLELDFWPYDLIFIIISNVVFAAIGIGLLIYGAARARLGMMNTGMAAVCVLIMMKFFDSDLDFLWRGVAFLVLGTLFLLINLRLQRTIKRKKDGENAAPG